MRKMFAAAHTGGVGLGLAMAVWGALLAGATGLQAQEREGRERLRERAEARDCRCVDAQGEEIENCRCIRMPRIEVVRRPMMPPRPRKAQIGVAVGADPDRGEGAWIEDVMEGSPAEEAGLEPGDRVLRVDGVSVVEPLPDPADEEALDPRSPRQVQRFVSLVGQLDPGEPVPLEVERDGRVRVLEIVPEEPGPAMGLRGWREPVVVWDDEAMVLDLDELEEVRRGAEELRWRMREELEELRELREEGDWPGVYRFETPEGDEEVRLEFFGLDPDDHGRAGLDRGDPCLAMMGERGRTGLLGMSNCVDGVEFMRLNEGLAEYFEADEGRVLVSEVAQASTLGLRAGDVLLAVDGREVRSPAHARRILRSYELEEELRLRILRRGEEMEVLGRRRD